MVGSFFFPVLIGIVLGALSGLGVGGGSLLLLWLTVVLDTQQEQARLMNLMFFIPCAFTASIFHFRQGKLNLPLTLTAVAAGCLGALIGNLWRQELDLEMLRRAFGLLFILCGIRELLYRPKELR